ncbi:hypothetical protein SMALA_8486 [Streptomyces malaysiensis subsp. malaysiensis]|nr:hypothetical protein SMALA_8486 [Streptomyces malaysiensis]
MAAEHSRGHGEAMVLHGSDELAVHGTAKRRSSSSHTRSAVKRSAPRPPTTTTSSPSSRSRTERSRTGATAATRSPCSTPSAGRLPASERRRVRRRPPRAAPHGAAAPDRPGSGPSARPVANRSRTPRPVDARRTPVHPAVFAHPPSDPHIRAAPPSGRRVSGRRLTFAIHARIGRRGERDRDHGGVRPSARLRHAAMSGLPGAHARC